MKYVVYYRVSTKEQGHSGLGLEAQKASVEQYLSVNNAEEVPPSYTEVESGRKNNRPELRRAVNRCIETGSTLLIAKLDRLSRDAAFILNLKKELEQAGVSFKSVDHPEMNTLMLSVMAGMAQQEREFNSDRTKEGIHQSPIYKSGNWGNPQNLTAEAKEKARMAISRQARENQANITAYMIIQPHREAGKSYREIADLLNAGGQRTRENKLFHPATVRTIYKRFSVT